jgi:hypothetical protein
VGDVGNVEQPEGDREPGAYRGIKTAKQYPGENRLEKKLNVQA